MPTLNWLTKETDLMAAANTPYRLLVEEEQYSYGEPENDNLLIHGDNLDALKSLLPFYAGQVKCIYIDPPFNTEARTDNNGNKLPYDDNLEHGTWLQFIYQRLVFLKELLSEDGAIFVNLDDIESAYCKVIMDEIFGRKNYLNEIIVATNKSFGFKSTSDGIFKQANHILLYAKDKPKFSINTKAMYTERGYDKMYNMVFENLDKSENEWTWRNISDVVAKNMGFNTSREAKKVDAENFEENIAKYALENPNNVFQTAAVTGGAYQKRKDTIDISKKNKNILIRHPNDDMDYMFIGGRRVIFYKERLKEIDGFMVPAEIITDIWNDISIEGLATEGGVDFPKGKKPEKLIERCLELVTSSGDLVLDSFLGSGTTAAVAHKMGRRYIGIEMGEQAKTHCVTRLKKVVDGEQSGISKSVGWKGGGGFRFFRLGEAVFDSGGQIKSGISFEHLAAHIYFTETKTPMKKPKKKSVFLGIHNDTAYALLYNGILGDKSISGGNVLTHNTLSAIQNDIDAAPKRKGGAQPYNKLVIYGEASRLTGVSLKKNNIVFKQTPYDIKVW